MNDALITRVAREDPAARMRPADAVPMLDRLRREIAADGTATGMGPGRSSESRQRVAAVVPAVAAVVAIVAVVTVIGSMAHRARHRTVTARSPAPARIVGSVSLPAGSEVVVAHAGVLWVAGTHTLTRLDPATGAVRRSIRLPTLGMAIGITFGAGSGWVVTGGGNTGVAPTLARIDPASGRILTTIDVARSTPGHLRVLSGGIAFSAGRVWLSRVESSPRGDVVAVDPATDQLAGPPLTVGTGPRTLLAAFGVLWVDNTGVRIGLHPAPVASTDLARIDPVSGRVTGEPLAGVPSAGFGSLWVGRGDAIVRYDPRSRRVVARIVVPRALAIACGAGRVWVVSGTENPSDPASRARSVLTAIDPQTDRVIAPAIHLNLPGPTGIAVSGRDVWIADFASGLLHLRAPGG